MLKLFRTMHEQRQTVLLSCRTTVFANASSTFLWMSPYPRVYLKSKPLSYVACIWILRSHALPICDQQHVVVFLNLSWCTEFNWMFRNFDITRGYATTTKFNEPQFQEIMLDEHIRFFFHNTKTSLVACCQ